MEPMMFAFILTMSGSLPPAPPPRVRPESPAESVRLAVPLLQQAAEGHIEQKTCFACHNQALPMLAFSTARRRGFPLNQSVIKAQTDHIAAFIASNRDKFKKGEGTGGQVDTAGYAVLTLELGGYKPDENTEAVVEYLLKTQAERDHWKTVSHRPPSEASDFTATYLALRAIKHWGTKEQKDRGAKRIESARAWLLRSKAKDTEDRVFRLFGLKESAADDTAIAAAAWELLKTQRADGGWSQLDSMESDAYATGTALVALHQAGGLATDHPAYTRGVSFLVKTQRTDGSWFIASRSKPFQPYYESGFPHGKDQFISAATTGWAATALMLGSAK
jgi:hypothetical protein